MKKTTLRLFTSIFLIASPAFAADMAVKAPPPPTITPFSWTGFYVGIEGGAAWGRSQFIDADPTNASVGLPITKKFDVSGGLFGGTVGYNRQFNNWVAGVEGDLSWVGQQGTGNSVPPFAAGVTDTAREHWLGTGRVRLGVVPADRWLVYAAGGFAAASVEAIVNTDTDGSLAATETRWGWTAGGGVETSLFQNWSLKLEYLYVGFEDKNYLPQITILPNFDIVRRTVTLNDNILRVGLNYKFK